MFFNSETLTSPLNKMAARKRNLLVVAVCLATLSHMLAYASSPLASKPATEVADSNEQTVAESKKKVKYVAVEVKEDKNSKMSAELMMATPKMDLSPPQQHSKLSGTELMMAPKMEIENMEPMKSMKPMSMTPSMSPKEVSMIMVPVVAVKDQSSAKMTEDLSEAAGHKKYVLVKKKPKMKKIKMEVYKPKMKYKKIKMKVPMKKMKKKKVKGYMVKKHHDHY